MKSLTRQGRDVVVTWGTTEGCCFKPTTWSARLHWDGSKLAVLDQGQLSGIRRSGPVIDATDAGTAAFVIPTEMSPAR